VDLERGRHRLQHHAVVGHLQVVATVDVDARRLAATQAHELLVECAVAVLVGHVVEHQVTLTRSRPDTDHHQPRVACRGRPAACRPVRFELVVQAPQAVPRERLGCAVQLDVEARQLGHHQRARELPKEGVVARRRSRVATDQPRLELEPRMLGVRVKAPPGQLAAEKCGFRLELPGEGQEIGGGEVRGVDLLAHDAP
jgi:hypothetical protein